MSGRILAVIGIILVTAALFSAKSIPGEANKDFDRLVRQSGGVMTHGQGFPDTYRQMCANRRMLQNVYVGGIGLICLAIGLAGMQRRM
ncbi:MAG: hypothetical protein PHR77_17930 [Kiritimatiellae bacterium]|nr:hypothetical protein [Kiritimatiellia bacterium]MDD5521113.1 hypothetical protein [Kiritimatiellia bacterium]